MPLVMRIQSSPALATHGIAKGARRGKSAGRDRDHVTARRNVRVIITLTKRAKEARECGGGSGLRQACPLVAEGCLRLRIRGGQVRCAEADSLDVSPGGDFISARGSSCARGRGQAQGGQLGAVLKPKEGEHRAASGMRNSRQALRCSFLATTDRYDAATYVMCVMQPSSCWGARRSNRGPRDGGRSGLGWRTFELTDAWPAALRAPPRDRTALAKTTHDMKAQDGGKHLRSRSGGVTYSRLLL